MNETIDLLFRIADIAVSLAILVSIYIGFVRGDLHSRKSTIEIVVLAVKETLAELRD